MSKLEELIQEYCPNGVEYKSVGEVCDTITDYTAAGSFADIAKNVQYINNGKGFAQLIRTTDLKNDFTNQDRFVYVNHHAFDYLWRVNLSTECLVMPNVGNCGEVYYVTPDILPEENNVLGPNAILVRSSTTNIRFLYHLFLGNGFQTKLAKIVSPTGQTKFNKTNFKQLTIPVPPLPVQEEIVRILDSFTQLTAELQAELQARKKQYEYYRNCLLEPTEDTPIVKLGDFATVARGGNFQKKHFKDTGFPCIHYGQMYTHFGVSTTTVLKYLDEDEFEKSKKAVTNDIVMAVTSENVEDVCSCTAWLGDNEIAVSGHTAIIHHKQNAKYLSYYFRTEHFYQQKAKLAHGTKVIEVTPSKLLDCDIPLPSIAEQNRIVAILDRFDALCNDISTGLPAEIEARQKQYEYYRDRLLSFEVLK